MDSPGISDILKLLSDQQKALRDEIGTRTGFENTLIQYIMTLIGAAAAGAITVRTTLHAPDGDKFFAQRVVAVVFLILPMATTPLSLMILNHEAAIRRIRHYLDGELRKSIADSLCGIKLPLATNFEAAEGASPAARIRQRGFYILLLAPGMAAFAAMYAIATMPGSFDPIPAMGTWAAALVDLAFFVALATGMLGK